MLWEEERRYVQELALDGGASVQCTGVGHVEGKEGICESGSCFKETHMSWIGIVHSGAVQQLLCRRICHCKTSNLCV